MASQKLVVPYSTIINGSLKPGKSIIIRGVVNTHPNRMEFNFRHRFGIAFHYNPRFNENVVVCNTWDGKWGVEQRPEGMPFKAGQPFEVYIYCTDHGYNVSVNGHQIHTYNHRFTQLNNIDVLDICGDLQLTSVDA